MTILFTYAIGFSLPLAAIAFGVSLGKTIPAIKKIDSTIRIIAGILLIAAGFYFLATI
jgi:cytochrome c biogenesis protein CcdA